MHTSSSSFRWLLITVAVLAWLALALQLYLLVANTPGNGLTPLQAIARFFLFFTILSNILVAICCTAQWIAPAGKWGLFFSMAGTQTAVCLYITIVGLVYNIILRALWKPTGLQLIADNLLHVIVPAGYLLYWWLMVKGRDLSWKQIPRWLIYPALYLAYALLRGYTEGYYPYPFIDPVLNGWTQVALNSAGMLLLFVITGAVMVAIKKWQNGGVTAKKING